MESLIPLADWFQQILHQLLFLHLIAVLLALVQVHFAPFLVEMGNSRTAAPHRDVFTLVKFSANHHLTPVLSAA